MRLLAKISNEETKQVDVAELRQKDHFEKIGFSEQDVEQAWNGSWYLKGYAPEKPIEQKESEVRAERDRRIDAIRWRIERYQTQKEAGLATTDDNKTYSALLLYAQYLRDFPQQDGEWWNAPILTFEEWGAAQ